MSRRPERPHPHAHAEDLLRLVNDPERLETMTLEEIKNAFDDASDLPESFEEGATGWTIHFPGSLEAKTGALIRTADDHLIDIAIGSEGRYFIEQIVENANAMSDTDREILAQYVHRCRERLSSTVIEGPAFHAVVDPLLGGSSDAVGTRRSVVMQQFQKLFGKSSE